MIKANIIKDLYIKHPHPIADKNNLLLSNLISTDLSHHQIEITMDDLAINSIDKTSPFHKIPLKNISGIENLESHIAIILRNSIIFLDKNNADVHIHIKMEQPSMRERLNYFFQRNY